MSSFSFFRLIASNPLARLPFHLLKERKIDFIIYKVYSKSAVTIGEEHFQCCSIVVIADFEHVFVSYVHTNK